MAASPPRRFAVACRRAPATSKRLCGQSARPTHSSLPVPFCRRSWPLPVMGLDPHRGFGACALAISSVPPMPELPEVETTVRGLVPVLEGRRLVSVETRRADLRRAFPPDLRQRLTGATVTSLGRRAKYGLIATDRDDTLVFHLGMSGRWRIDPD